jgi:flagellin-like protein
MLTKNMLKSKKAISPILATLLLIVIAVAAIVVTYAWVMTYMGSTTQQASIILYDENVRFLDSGKTPTTELTIGNSGTGDTQLVRLYVGTSADDLSEVTDATTGLNTALNAGSVVTLTLDWEKTTFGDWTAGETYYFRVVPQQGQAYPFSAKAPQ